MTTSPLTTPTRIAFAGDWHENAVYAQRAIRYARKQNADVLVHLGDFGYSFSDHFVNTVTRDLGRAGMPLLFVDGNHEDHPKLNQYPVEANGLRKVTDRVWHLPRGFRWQWDGVRFLALGGAHSVDRPYRTAGVSWWSEEATG